MIDLARGRVASFACNFDSNTIHLRPVTARSRIAWTKPRHRVMLLFAVICGLSTLRRVTCCNDSAPRPSPLFRFSSSAYLSGGWFASIQLAGELRRGVFDINLLMIVVAIGAACVGAWAEGGTLLFLFSLSNALEQLRESSHGANDQLAPQVSAGDGLAARKRRMDRSTRRIVRHR